MYNCFLTKIYSHLTVTERTQVLSFTRYVMSNTNTTSTPNTSSDIRGRFIILRIKTDKPIKWPDVHYLSYYTEYLLVPECKSTRNPSGRSTGKELEVALESFIDIARKKISKETIKFPKNNSLKFNVSNGFIAVYANDNIEVAKTPMIWEEALTAIGYTRDESLPVPFANGESYYDKYKDELLTLW